MAESTGEIAKDSVEVKCEVSNDGVNESDNFKENNIEVVAVVDEKGLKNETAVQQKHQPDLEWYKQYEDKLFTQAQAHRNAVLAASLQYLKPNERERLFAQFNSSILSLPSNRILTPPPSSSSSSSQQNISPQSASSTSSTNEGSLMERYGYATPYQTNKPSNEQEKLVAAHQALLAQYAAQQFNAYQTHASHFQNQTPFSIPTPSDPRMYHQKSEKVHPPPFSLYNPLNLYFPPSQQQQQQQQPSNSPKPANIRLQSMSTSSLSIDEQRASPHTNSYDDNMDEENDDGINEEDGENQSLNDTNGEWTYEEQFKQV